MPQPKANYHSIKIRHLPRSDQANLVEGLKSARLLNTENTDLRAVITPVIAPAHQKQISVVDMAGAIQAKSKKKTLANAYTRQAPMLGI